MTTGMALEQHLWDLVRHVIRYGVDEVGDYPLEIDGESYGSVDRSTFIEKLYVQRDNGRFEKELEKKLRASIRLVVLAAPRGTGKSSSLEFVSDGLRASGLLVETIDFRSIFDRAKQESRLGSGDPAGVYRKIVEETLRQRFFPNPNDTPRALAWLLAGSFDEGDDFHDSLVADLHDVSIKVWFASGAHDKTKRSDRQEAILQWFTNKPTDFLGIYEEVLPKLRIAHAIAAKKGLDSPGKIVVIYDNVDRIVPEDQEHFVQLAIDSQQAMGTLCTSCIAIRNENLRGRPRTAGTVDYAGTKIDVILPDDDLHDPTEHIGEVLKRRLDFAVSAFAKRHKEPKQSSSLGRIHEVIAAEFRHSELHRLTNASIRAIGLMYCTFGDYLFRLRRKFPHEIEAVLASGSRSARKSRVEGQLQTLFYLWLRSSDYIHGVRVFDVLKSARLAHSPTASIETILKHARALSAEDLASEHHFVLTATKNLSENTSGKFAAPTYSDVVTRLSAFGFTFPRIRGAIRDLCKQEEEGPNALEFVHTEPNLNELEETSQDTIQLTPLGDVLVSSIFSKVGYIFAVASEHDSDLLNNSPVGVAYLKMLPSERIELIVRYLRNVMAAHLVLLEKFAENWRKKEQSEGWVEQYQQQFGVGKCLQLDRVLEECSRFYLRYLAGRGQENLFATLQEKYRVFVDMIRAGNDFTDDFVKAFTQSQDRVKQLLRADKKTIKKHH